MKTAFKYLLTITAGTILGLGLANTDAGLGLSKAVKSGASSVSSAALEKIVSSSESMGTRDLVLLENPSLIKAIMKGGAFGGEFSRAAAQDMFGRYNQKAIDEVTELSRIEQIAPRTWMLYLPIVMRCYSKQMMA